jgi:BirA family biotin operon repressor/biotin-[acetyl-CoA-carboxylase] ligase
MLLPFQPTILRYDSLPSTNTEAASQAARGAPEGLCIVAREQTRGRGRQERVWASPPDAGLYFSIILRPRLDVGAWPLITLMAALAVRDALREACALEADIKWPNDILAADSNAACGGRKLCGILAETVETKSGRACILGIGINLSERAYPPELHEHATSIEGATGKVADSERVLAALVAQLTRRYAQLHTPAGQSEIIKDWSANSSYASGKRVRVHTATEIFNGTTRGLEPDGALRVETATGETRIVRAGDVHALRSETMNAER